MLGEDLLDPAAQPAAILSGQIERSNDDDRHIPPCWISLEGRHNLEPVHFRHHQIQQYDIRQFARESIDCKSSVYRFSDHPTLGLEGRADELSVFFVIINNKNSARRSLTR